jgi:AAA+ superfamily predicted ATPase
MDNLSKFIDQAENSEYLEVLIKVGCNEIDVSILRVIAYIFLETETTNLKNIMSTLDPSNTQPISVYLSSVYNLLSLGLVVVIGDIDYKKLSSYELLHLEIRLSNSFFRYIEKQSVKIFHEPKNEKYKSYNDYLEEQFEYIEILQQIKLKKYLFPAKEILLPTLSQQLLHLEKQIKQRLEVTQIKLPIIEAINKYKLNNYEKLIVLVLLKDEYFPNKEIVLSDLDSLLNVLCGTNQEKFKIRNMLTDVKKSKLFRKNIIVWESGFIPTSNIPTIVYSLSYKFLENIGFIKKEKKKKRPTLKKMIKAQQLFEFVKSKYKIENVVLNDDTKETLESLLAQVNIGVINRLKKWNIKEKHKNNIDAKIILYGEAGTGKTMTAIALANSLKKDVVSLDCSKILSKWVGESEQNVREIFDSFKYITKKTKTDPILLLNEADQFLSTRTNSSSGSDKMHNQMQNIFLEQIERFDGILIATTNLLENIDKAFSRRFNYKIEFTKPSRENREKLWQTLLPPNLPLEEGFDIKELSGYTLTGGQIELVIKNTAYKVAIEQNPIFTVEKFKKQIEKELKGMFDSSASMGFVQH